MPPPGEGPQAVPTLLPGELSHRTTSLRKLARELGVDTEQARAAVVNLITWGGATATVDVSTAADHKVFELSPVGGAVPPPALDRARWMLRTRQDNLARISGRPAADALGAARRCAAQRADRSRFEGNDIRVGPWLFTREVEEERWARTLHIVERAQPGPYEDGAYLETLAREAAAIEMTLAPAAGGPSVFGRALERIVLGTVDDPTGHAGVARLGDGVAVTISTGLVDFLCAAATSVILALRPKPSPAGVLTTLSARPDDTVEMLAGDDAPVVHLEHAMAGWLLRGSVRAHPAPSVPDVYRPMLALLTAFAQRFVVAHEYGHALVDRLGVRMAWPTGPSPDAIDKEFRADLLGAHMVFSSAALDRVKPNIALQGAVLAMKSQELIERAVEMVRGGESVGVAPPSTHPPFALRLENLYRFYAYLIRETNDPRLAVEALAVPADTAELLWRRARPRLAESLVNRRPHPIWWSKL